MPHLDLLPSIVNTADSRRDRWLPALHPGYARADDRSLAELLDFAVRFAGLIKYYAPDDTVAGDWSGFFATDPILVLASIATTNVRAMERKLATLVRRIRAERTERRKRELFDELFESALELPRRIDRWLDALEAGGSSRTARRARSRIAADVRDQVRQQVHLLRAWDARKSLPQARDYSAFGLDWSLRAARADAGVPARNEGVVEIDGALPQIVGAWQPIADAVARWASAAPSQIAAAVDEADGRHRPHVALFVAFAHLLGTAQESINDFAARRADFYYRRVLRDRNLESLPDAVFVTFDAAVSATPVSATIPRGTGLTAGKDAEGRDRIFVSCDDVTVTDASLAVVRTVRTVVGPLLPREGGHVIERVVSRELTRDDANAAGFAAFGRDNDEPAAIGFAVGAPTLWLRGGRRTVTLTIRCGPTPPATSEILTRLNLAAGLDNDQILERLLQGAFALSVSSSTGWLPIEGYVVELAPGGNGPGFRLRFSLAADAPPVAPLAGAPLTVECPAVRVRLRQQRVALDDIAAIAVYPLSVLAGLAVTSVDVHVSVEQLVPAAVEISGGAVDATKPFPAFGPVPAVGSFLTIRERELFMKDVDALTLRITWFTLPPDDTGFAGYYRGYVIGPNALPQEGLFDNQVFRAAIGDSEHCLFRTANSAGPIPEPDGRLSRHTVFQGLAIPSAGAGNDGAGRDSLRVELTAPPYAFGHGIYAQNVLHAAMAPQTATACEASCQAEYAFLLHAARNVESVLPPLTQTGLRRRLVEAARTFKGLRTRARTLGANTTTTLGSLADAACESLVACLGEWKELFPVEQLNAWRERLAACRRGPALQRLSACEALRATLRGATLGRAGAPASSHLQRCDLILSVALWVRDSDDGYSDESEWRYRRTTRANLTTCISELRARYDAAVKTCTADCAQRKLQFRPNTPHLPQIESLSFDYSASEPATLFAHLLPFDGHRRLEESADSGGGTLLPRFAHEGNLYFGFSRLDGRGTLPLYVGIGQADGAAPTAISWSYLAGNRWLSLPPPRHDADTTYGLQASGILRLTVPAKDAGEPSSVLPGSLRWIRAAADDPRDVRQVLGIYPHAVKAMRHADGGNFDEPLPMRTIAALAKPVKGIALVTQPASSIGGRAAERDRDFQVRMSERLRHKGRAIVGWDYEHIVLERFPTVWKVRTLPAQPSRHGEQGGGRGAVRVVVVPGSTSPDITDATAPRSSAETLASIARLLQQAAGPFVRVQVLNPIYVRVKVTANIRWREGADPPTSADRLDAELKMYLSPWDNDIRGDRAVSGPEIEEFVQSRSYVELVSALAIAYDPAEPLGSEPERCFLTTAAVHEIHGEVPVATALQIGY
jgi:hypothetical protein